MDEKFESEGLQPCDVIPSVAPGGQKPPGAPAARNDDGQAHSRGGIRVGLAVGDRHGARDGSGDLVGSEAVPPPVEVTGKCAGTEKQEAWSGDVARGKSCQARTHGRRGT